MENNNTAIGILGAGISGLATAYYLQKEGYSSTVYEQSESIGGAIKTNQTDNWLVDEGPNTLMVKSPQMWALLNELNLSSKVAEANNCAKRRYIVKDRQPVPLPHSFTDFLTTTLISGKAKLHLLKEPFINASEATDESIATFIRRRLGREPLDYGFNPAVSGIYAGDPKKLSIKHTFPRLWRMEQQQGSLLKGLIRKDTPANKSKRSLISFTGGNQLLPKALANQLNNPVQTSTTVKEARYKNGQWNTTVENGHQPVQTHHKLIISTLPAYELAGIFGPDFSTLSTIDYAPISIAALGYRDEQIQHPLDGFGMLVPAAENMNLLGALFSSTLFCKRAPRDHQLCTCFIGGTRSPELAAIHLSELKKIAHSELKSLLHITGQPVYSHLKCWPQGIPQYRVGYDRILENITKLENEYNGLLLEGNFKNGISVSDCILSAAETAQKATRYMKNIGL